jgi:uncharacterized protein YkwD
MCTPICTPRLEPAMLHHRLAKLLRALPVKATHNRIASPQSVLFESMESRVLMVYNPTANEQYTLELINDMRMNPAQHLTRLVTSITPLVGATKDIQNALDFFKVNGEQLAKEWALLTPVAPVAWNDALTKAATTHTTLMIAADQQSHQLPGEADLVTRNTVAGYTNFRFMGENLYNYSIDAFYGQAGFAIDWGFTPTGIQTPAGHRDNLMSPNFKEVGINIQFDNNPATTNGPMIITQEFGDRFTLTNPYLLGTVYDDLNGNGYYEPGEGLSGVTVTMKSATNTFTTTSLTAGGYQLNVPSGTYTVTYSGGKFANPVTHKVVLGTSNVHDNATLQELVPVVSIAGSGNTIANNDITPSPTDGTLITDLNPVGETTRTFSIQNTGTGTLNLSNFDISGSFTLITAPLLNIAPGKSSDFTIRFNPTVSGQFIGTFSVDTNDPGNKTYSFNLQADVTLPAPNITVSGNDIEIADNDTTPALDDGTLVSIPFNGVGSSPSLRSFHITNSGTKTLNILSQEITKGYTFQTAPPTSLAPGASADFTVLFTPTAAGTFNGTVTLKTNDPDTATYNFALQTQTVPTPPTFAGTVTLLDPSVFLGNTFKTSLLVENTGPVVANGFKAEFFLSKDVTLDVGDLKLLESLSTTSKLLPGQSISLDGTLKAPATTVPGNYFLIARVTSGAVIIVTPVSDSAISVQEVPKLPDLALTATVTGSLFSPGDSAKVGFSAKNLGPGGIGASSIRFVLSKDKIFGNEDDVLLSNIATPELKATAVFASTTNFLTIPEVTDGSYFILASADPDNLTVEKSETNNLFTSAALKIFKPLLGIKAGTAKFAEGNGSTTFTLTRTLGSTVSPVTANFSLTGSGVQNVDYRLMVDKTFIDGQSIVIPAGKSSVTVKLVGLEDSIVEPTENIQITLLPDLSAPPAYNVNGSQSNISFTLEDNEPSVKLVATTSKASESGGTATFTATRKSTSNKESLTVSFAVSGNAIQGTDYILTSSDGKTLLSNSFTFAPNATTFAIKLTVLEDSSIESDENVTLSLIPAAGSPEPTYTIDGQNSGVVTIADNEPSIKLVATTTKASESTGFATYTATRKSTSTKEPLTVFFAVSGTAIQGTDYILTSGDGKTLLNNSFTFAANSSTFSIKLAVLEDSIIESDETATLSLIPAVPEPTYTIEAQNSGVVTIIDNEPSIKLVATTTKASEPGGTATFTATRKSTSTKESLTVSFSVTGSGIQGTDYMLTSGDGKTLLSNSFTFAPNSSTFSIKLTVLDDTLAEADETATLSLIPAAGSPEPTYTIDPQSSGTVIIKDNEPTISVTATTPEAKEGTAKPAVFTFARSTGSSTAETLINFKITGDAILGDDYSLLAGTKGSVVTINQTDEGILGTILLPKSAASAILNLFAAKDNNNDEPTENLVVTLDSSSAYTVGVKNAATARIVDVDVAKPISVAPLVMPDLGARISLTSALSKTAKISVPDVVAPVTKTTFTGNLFSTGNWIGTYTYETFSAGPDANKILFTAIIRAGTTPPVNITLALTFTGARPVNLTGKQISFYPGGTANTDGTFTATNLPSDPDTIFTGTFAL